MPQAEQTLSSAISGNDERLPPGKAALSIIALSVICWAPLALLVIAALAQ